ncbi:MAG: lysyl-tRNA synthetase class 2 [Glaciecola sp.]|jgi:lysyl-tRNA synthetase class 2
MNIPNEWQPSGSVESLVKRAQILTEIRQYFAAEKVLEVETPTISPSTITDVHLEAMRTVHTNPHSVKKTHLFLQTSPEYYMKRMLCAGFPSIYQITKCYRDDEVGRCHNPEFTMLEWYRLGFSMVELIKDVDMLLRLVLDTPACEKITYRELFVRHLDLDVKSDTDFKIVTLCKKFGYENIVPSYFKDKLSQFDRDMLLQLLFCEKIERQIGLERPIAVMNFPASQASLAKIDPSDPWLSLRFEFYYKGIELANGFEELNDADEQKTRFILDNKQRKECGLDVKAEDVKFLNALKVGLPKCSGVALGIDRLLMLALGKKHISEVLSFDFASL